MAVQEQRPERTWKWGKRIVLKTTSPASTSHDGMSLFWWMEKKHDHRTSCLFPNSRGYGFY